MFETFFRVFRAVRDPSAQLSQCHKCGAVANTFRQQLEHDAGKHNLRKAKRDLRRLEAQA